MSVYNVKIFHYTEGSQIRLYKTPIIKDDTDTSVSGNISDCGSEVGDGRGLCDDIVDYFKMYFDSDGNRLFPDCTNEDKFKHSLRSSVNRTKQTIYNIARSNRWELFLTLTFDTRPDPDSGRYKLVTDRSDYQMIMKKVSKWLNHLREIYPDLKYILVPELHADKKNYHLHGLLAGVPLTEEEFRDSGKMKQGSKIYNWKRWEKSFGWCTVSVIKDMAKTQNYIAKYITKDLEQKLKHQHRYLASNNCERTHTTELNLTPEQIETLLGIVGDDITYMKTQSDQTFNTVSYIEVSRNDLVDMFG